VRGRALPSAREVVSSGLLVAAAGTRELRRASLYFGLIVLGACGPFVAYTLLVIAKASTLPDETDGAAVILLWFAIAGAIAVGIEATAVALAIVGGRAAGKPISLRAALGRSRAVFWRLVGAWLVTTIASVIARSVVGFVLPTFAPPESLTAGLLATVVTAPLAYAQAGIVLGDVGPLTSVRRSVVLTRARPAYAGAIVLFALAATIVQVFAISGGLEILGRLEGLFGIDFTTSGGLVVLLLAAFAMLVALGSLVFTILAIQGGPQVVAFLALTGYSSGLDVEDAASPEPTPAGASTSWWSAPPPAGSGFRWVTRPMTAMIVVGVVARSARS
jgi:hypothetical protein